QISKEAMMPMGISRCGFFASWAAVLTASNPMYAKKTKPAPLNTPDQPYSPQLPVFGGIKGCQLAGLIARLAATMKRRTTATLMMTMILLNPADSLMPTTNSTVTRATMMTAGRLKIAVTCGSVVGSTPRFLIWSASAAVSAVQPTRRLSEAANAAGRSMTCVPMAAASSPGTCIPISPKKEITYPDQPTETAIAPTAYSRTKSQPMIHAKSS